MSKPVNILFQAPAETHQSLKALSKAFRLPMAELVDAMLSLTLLAMPPRVTNWLMQHHIGAVTEPLKDPIWPHPETVRRLLRKNESWMVMHPDEVQRMMTSAHQNRKEARDQRDLYAKDSIVFQRLLDSAREVCAARKHFGHECTDIACVCPMGVLRDAVAETGTLLDERKDMILEVFGEMSDANDPG